MNNNSSYFDSLMSSLPKMSSVTVDSMLTPQLKNALLSISQSYSSVALNASVQSITVAYRSVLSSLGIASATLLSECSQVLSTHSPVIEAAKTANCSLSHFSLSMSFTAATSLASLSCVPDILRILFFSASVSARFLSIFSCNLLHFLL